MPGNNEKGEEMISTGQHQRVVMYGDFPVCDTCINVLGLNIRWDQSHPEGTDD